MTASLRELLRGLRTRNPTTAGPPERDPGGSAIDVLVRVPEGVAPAAATGLGQALDELFTQRSRELGVNRQSSIHIESSPSARPTVDVSVDGRPVASDVSALAEDDAEHWSRAVAVRVDRALRRHLSVLLDELSTERYAAKVGAFVSAENNARYRMVPGYLLDNGISLEAIDKLKPEPGSLDGLQTGAEISEVIINAAAPHVITVELTEATLRKSKEAAQQDLLGTRKKIYFETGVQFPDVNLKIGDLPPGEAYIELNQVRLPRVRMHADADWHDLVRVLHESVRVHIQWFLRADDAEAARGVLGDALPDLVRLSRHFYGAPLLTACLRSLVRNGDNSRNLPRILWLLLETGAARAGGECVRLGLAQLGSSGSGPEVQRDPDILASALRRWVEAEAWQVDAPAEGPPIVRLPLELETALIEPADAAALGEAEWRAVRAIGSVGGPSRVVTHSIDALRPVRDALSALPDPPKVMASMEFPPDTELPPV
jgi:hypothetical protein